MNAKTLIRDAERNRKGYNTTRLYRHIVPTENGEARIDTYAVKTHPKTKKLIIRKVAKYFTDGDRFIVSGRVMMGCTLHNYEINWCDYDFGHKHLAVWEDVDSSLNRWYSIDRKFRCNYQLWGKFLNDFTGTKYEHCGYDTDKFQHLNVLDYLACWNINKGTSFLYNNSFARFVNPKFIKALTNHPEFARFFRSSAKLIQEKGYGSQAVLRAFYRKESIAEAEWYLSHIWVYKDFLKQIPKAVDKKELFRKLDKGQVNIYSLCSYYGNLAYLGKDITAHGLMYPTTATMNRINEETHLRWQEENERQNAKEKAERIARCKKYLNLVSEVSGKYYLNDLVVVFPTSQEEYVAEGKAMNNCIGDVYNFGDADNIIGFIRKDGKPYIDFRIDTDDFSVAEARYYDNEDAEKDIYDFCKTIAHDLKDKYRKVA